MNLKSAVQAVDRYGMCLVFPIDNSKDTPSLWYHFYPRTKMRWEWDDNGDNRVAELWHLREQLSRSRKVVYVKWFKGRATLFSRRAFVGLLRHMNPVPSDQLELSKESREMLSILEDNSPLSTKQLKRATELEGKYLETIYTRSLKALWDRLLIVGFGEFDDGAFPSLGIGSTKHMFEDLWKEAFALSPQTMTKELSALLSSQEPVAKQVARLKRNHQAPPPSPDLSFLKP